MGTQIHAQENKIKFLEYYLSDWMEMILTIGLLLIPVIIVAFIQIGWLRYRLFPSVVIILLMLAGSVLLFLASFASAMGGGAGHVKNTLWAGWIPFCLWIGACSFFLFMARRLRRVNHTNAS